MTKDELKKVYADVESRIKLTQETIDEIDTDLEKIDVGFEDGVLSVDEFLDDIGKKKDELVKAKTKKKNLHRALYLIGKEIEEDK